MRAMSDSRNTSSGGCESKLQGPCSLLSGHANQLGTSRSCRRRYGSVDPPSLCGGRAGLGGQAWVGRVTLVGERRRHSHVGFIWLPFTNLCGSGFLGDRDAIGIWNGIAFATGLSLPKHSGCPLPRMVRCTRLAPGHREILLRTLMDGEGMKSERNFVAGGSTSNFPLDLEAGGCEAFSADGQDCLRTVTTQWEAVRRGRSTTHADIAASDPIIVSGGRLEQSACRDKVTQAAYHSSSE